MASLYERKYPKTVDKHVGIEIEFFISLKNKAKLENYFKEHGLVKNIHIGRDGSLVLKESDDIGYIKKYAKRRPYASDLWLNEDEMRQGCEIRILATEKTAPDIIKTVCHGIKKFQGLINETCGLHVHLDMRSRNFEIVYHNLYQYQSMLYATQPKKRRESRYCQKITNLKDPQLNQSKYYGINKQAMSRHTTIEIRMHEGSIDDKEIKRWVYLLIKIASLKDKVQEVPTGFEGLKLHPIVKGYLYDRVKKFA